jgi:hypothetical protein
MHDIRAEIHAAVLVPEATLIEYEPPRPNVLIDGVHVCHVWVVSNPNIRELPVFFLERAIGEQVGIYTRIHQSIGVITRFLKLHDFGDHGSPTEIRRIDSELIREIYRGDAKDYNFGASDEDDLAS